MSLVRLVARNPWICFSRFPAWPIRAACISLRREESTLEQEKNHGNKTRFRDDRFGIIAPRRCVSPRSGQFQETAGYENNRACNRDSRPQTKPLQSEGQSR